MVISVGQTLVLASSVTHTGMQLEGAAGILGRHAAPHSPAAVGLQVRVQTHTATAEDPRTGQRTLNLTQP